MNGAGFVDPLVATAQVCWVPAMLYLAPFPWIARAQLERFQPPHFFGFFQGAPGSSEIMRDKTASAAWSLFQE